MHRYGATRCSADGLTASSFNLLLDVINQAGKPVKKTDIGDVEYVFFLRVHSPNIVPKILDICRIRTKCHPENISFETL